MAIVVRDAASNNWVIGVTVDGLVTATPSGNTSPDLPDFVITDDDGNHWVLGVTTEGLVTATPADDISPENENRCTINLQKTLNWCGGFINFQPLTIGGPEPAETIANIVLQTILGPPFCWRFNREEVSFTTTKVGNAWPQDYTLAIADFGFIERAWLIDESGEVKELTNRLSQSEDASADRPQYISVQEEDSLGNVTFRLMPLPAENYTVKVMYQKRPKKMNSLASTWAPLPDELQYIYDWGFLALASILTNDPRIQIFNQKFTSHLLGAQDGLDELQRNIFLGNWLEITSAAAKTTLKASQGVAARQV